MIRNREDKFHETRSLGKLKTPAAWDSFKIAHAFEMIGSGTTPSSQDESYFSTNKGIPWVTTGELREILIKNTAKYVSDNALAKYSALQIHPKGSLLIAMYGATIGRLGILDIPATTNQACCVLSYPRMLDPKFLFFWFIAFKKDLIALYSTGGGQPNISQSVISSLRVPAPSIPEQQKIAQFLDYETAKIDELIDEQKRLIELLKEKCQAVISHAVTKGLNPDAPMKDSGVEWLGEVPEHWLCGSLGYYSRIETGSTPDRNNSEYWGGDIPWIKTGEVNYQTIFNSEESITPLATKESSVRLAPPGTLLMAMYGQGVTRGRVAILGVHATFNQACAAITVNQKLKVEFLELYLKFAYSFIRDVGNETSQMNLNASYVAKIPIVVPPLEEQEEIIKTLNEAILKLSSLETESKALSATLKERRSALISAAVTGKIDVRDWQPPAGSDTVDSNTSMQTERHYG